MRNGYRERDGWNILKERRSYCGQTSFNKWTDPLSSDHSLWIPTTGTEVPRQRIITGQRVQPGKMAHAVWTRSRPIFSPYRSDFLKEFTLPRILLGIVKPAPSSICQTVELPFDETFPLYKSPRNGYLGLPTATETARFPSKRLILIESQILGFEILCTTKWFLGFGIMDNCWICSLRKKD